jgi:hypothetical protein
MGGFILALNEQVLFFCLSLKRLLYACKENTLKGKQVSKLYLYGTQLIMSEHEKKKSFYPITRWVELNQKTISHYFLFKHYSEDHQKAFCVPNDLSMARGRGGDRCSEVPGYSRRRPY